MENKTTMKFEDSFFKEETRCDYLVTAKEKKVWAIEIDLVAQIMRVCNKYGLKMCVFAGTLLGTVRHKGFIPWDDDLDVCMLRSDYERFIEVAKDEFQYPYFLQTALTDSQYYIGYARLRNSLTTGHILDYESENYNHGLYVDIHVLDGYIENKFKLKKQLLKKSILYHLVNSYKLNYYRTKGFKLMAKKCLYYFLHCSFCKVIPYERTVKLCYDNLSRYNEETERFGLMTHTKDFIEKYWCKKSDIQDLVLMPFENIQVPVPRNYDAILKNIYGDYMQYPPVEKRGAWHKGILVVDPDLPFKEYFKNRIK